MANPRIDIPVRAPAATAADDTVLPFEVSTLDLRGRVVRYLENGVAIEFAKPVEQAHAAAHR